MEEVSNFCPAMAVPMTVNMPEPMTAPMPSAVSETGPSVFFRRRSACSESAISLSMDLQQKSWFLPAFGGESGALLVVGDGDNGPHSRKCDYLILAAPVAGVGLQGRAIAPAPNLTADGRWLTAVYRFACPRTIFFTF